MAMLKSKSVIAIVSFSIVLIIGYFTYAYLKTSNSPNLPRVLGTQDIKNISYPKIAPVPIKSKDSSNPDIKARYVALFDVDSGAMLYGSNENEKVPIASVTKIMSAVISLENYKLEDIVSISKQAATINGSVIMLRTDEKITVKSLLEGLLIQSGNDAAHALAEHYSTILNYPASPEEATTEFVKAMNKKAQDLELSDTKYLDPAGLDDNGYSSARNQGILISYALRNSTFKSIISTPESIIASVDGKITHKIDNSNRLVKQEMYYPGIIGGKTGFTPTAGHNLVTAAVRDGHTLVAVIISTYDTKNTAASAIEARKLLDWGFNNFNWINI